MTHPFRSLSAFTFIVAASMAVTGAFARDFSGSNIERYTDGPWDRSTNIAVSVLTDQNVLRGNDDGTFRADSPLNRAEFVTIAMRLTGGSSTRLSCFPDVADNAWYARDVCAAKFAGYVRGNAEAGVSPDLWRFEPVRAIQYEEALKILTKIFAVPVYGSTDGAVWYLPYVHAADQFGIGLPGLIPGQTITRGEMARLTVAFQAYTEGSLDDLRAAEAGSSSSRSSQSSSSRISVSSSSRSSASSVSTDPLTDTSVQANILALGETTPILAGVKFFSNNEPIRVDQIDITLNGTVQSVSMLRVYDSSGNPLGSAVRDDSSSSVFKLHLSTNAFLLPRREDTSVYIRAVLKEYDAGGVSGEVVEVNNVTLHGYGDWSSDAYTSTSTDTFTASQTARATIIGFSNAGLATSVLSAGSSQLLAQFRVDSMKGDSLAQVRITDLNLRIEGTGVGLSNVRLSTDGGDETTSCSVASSTISCASIPAGVGIVDTQKTIRVYGDVTVNSNVTNPSLRLTINEPGTLSSAGDVTWTDGTTTFQWLPLDTPVVRGTMFN